eukprot:TRINITY_DN49710_c0_g1_i1.p1 TRINITY_DN49710_c0_g1~~TRINITY_DN49710_c0_g1_i1.p1  ORF type:complete len:501 (-),score=76.87 TRINITY_DN49710_c0_g1_i1:150-1652(-)
MASPVVQSRPMLGARAASPVARVVFQSQGPSASPHSCRSPVLQGRSPPASLGASPLQLPHAAGEGFGGGSFLATMSPSGGASAVRSAACLPSWQQQYQQQAQQQAAVPGVSRTHALPVSLSGRMLDFESPSHSFCYLHRERTTEGAPPPVGAAPSAYPATARAYQAQGLPQSFSAGAARPVATVAPVLPSAAVVASASSSAAAASVPAPLPLRSSFSKAWAEDAPLAAAYPVAAAPGVQSWRSEHGGVDFMVPFAARALEAGGKPNGSFASCRLSHASTAMGSFPTEASSARSSSFSYSAQLPPASASIMPPARLPDVSSVSDEYSYPSADLQALLQYLDWLMAQQLRFTEVTYLMNDFRWWGIPMKHHGFVLKATRQGLAFSEYLTLDFSRRGILWDTFDERPDHPEGTSYARTYKIDKDPHVLRRYCAETQPFSWPHNDCETWAKGLLRVLDVRDRYLAPGPVHSSKSARGAAGSTGLGLDCSGGRPRGGGGAIGCFP